LRVAISNVVLRSAFAAAAPALFGAMEILPIARAE
jgi:hypothetical protein